MVRIYVLVAATAVSGVLLPGAQVDHAHHRTARTGERPEAQLAARRGRKAPPEAPKWSNPLIGTIELAPPIGLGSPPHGSVPPHRRGDEESTSRVLALEPG